MRDVLRMLTLAAIGLLFAAVILGVARDWVVYLPIMMITQWKAR